MSPPPRLLLPAYLRQTIEAHAAAGYPDEVCGYLIGQWSERGVEVLEALPGRNVAGEASDRFELDADDTVRVQRRCVDQGDREIVGFYHTHPDGAPRPSERDLEWALAWPGYQWAILGVSADRPATIACWTLAAEDDDEGDDAEDDDEGDDADEDDEGEEDEEVENEEAESRFVETEIVEPPDALPPPARGGRARVF